MEVLKTLLIVVIIFAIGINGDEESNREARCNKNKSIGKQNQGHKGHMRKPYPLLHHEDLKFQRKKEFPSKVSVHGPSSLSHADSNAKEELRKPVQNPKVDQQQETEVDAFNMFMHGDALVADPMEIPSTFGISPRLSISADGEVTVARSLNFNKNRNFHDDSIVEYIRGYDHMDEDSDHFHKIRTARSAPSGKESGPEQLSSTLGQLQGAHSAQGVDVHNGASAGEYLNLSASGDNISVANQGGSSASGTGTISSSGSTTITTSGKNQ